jgi:hypothetical protein
MGVPYPMQVDFTDSSVISMPHDAPGLPDQPLSELDWAPMLQHLTQLQRRPQDYPFQFNLVRLVSWPSLTWVPQDVQPAMARLCALLARKPSAASLLPLLLELPEAQVFMLIEALRLYGHVQVAGTAAGPEGGASAFGPLSEAAGQVQPTAPSLIAKIWQRLLSRE